MVFSEFRINDKLTTLQAETENKHASFNVITELKEEKYPKN